MKILDNIERVANKLLEFSGSKYVTVEISKKELVELEADIAEEYDDLSLTSVGFDKSFFTLELLGILFTLKVK